MTSRHIPTRRTEDGFITTIILILVALVLLQNVFHVDVTGFISSSFFGDFVRDIAKMAVAIWDAIKSALTATT